MLLCKVENSKRYLSKISFFIEKITIFETKNNQKLKKQKQMFVIYIDIFIQMKYNLLVMLGGT